MKKTLNIDSVEAKAKAKQLIVDVRTREEFARGAFPGAVNIPLDELEFRIDEIGAKDKKIILYCASGSRSAHAAKFLGSCGFKNLENGGGLSRMMSRKGIVNDK